MIVRPQTIVQRRGTTVVESAFVIAIFFLFLVGIIEYARFLFFLHVATNATANAARYAVVRTGDGTTIAQVQQVCTDTLGAQTTYLTGYTVDVFAAETGVSPPTPIGGAAWNDVAFGAGICVRVTGNYEFAGASLLGISSVPVTVSAVMTSEAN